MENTLIADLRHLLTDDETLPPMPRPAERLARFLCSIIESVTSRPLDDKNYVTAIPCRRRPDWKPCGGGDHRLCGQGKPYTGRTASGERLRTYHPGLVSINSLTHPWLLPVRVAFPWLWLPQDGTVATDTDF